MIWAILYIFLSGFLWRLGGSDYFSKNIPIKGIRYYRVVGCPVITFIYLYFTQNIQIATFCAFLQGFSSTLPITLEGDHDEDNLTWFPFLGLFYGLCTLSLEWTLMVALVYVTLKAFEIEDALDRVKVEFLTGVAIALGVVL